MEDPNVVAKRLTATAKDVVDQARVIAKDTIARFEATEEKRRRREYRQMRKEQFRRPEPGFSLYEGRTRGKRIKYTFSDDEADFFSDSTGPRRSTRNRPAMTRRSTAKEAQPRCMPESHIMKPTKTAEAMSTRSPHSCAASQPKTVR